MKPSRCWTLIWIHHRSMMCRVARLLEVWGSGRMGDPVKPGSVTMSGTQRAEPALGPGVGNRWVGQQGGHIRQDGPLPKLRPDQLYLSRLQDYSNQATARSAG